LAKYEQLLAAQAEKKNYDTMEKVACHSI